VLGTSAGLYSVAQEENPFGAAPAAEAPKGKAEEEAAPATPPRNEHPVLRGLRESGPKTLDELTRATRISLQMNRPDEFKRYAKDWLALKPTDADLAALNRKYGSALFMEMSRKKEFQPEGTQVADVVLTGAAKYTRDPMRLNDAIAKLAGPDSVTRAAALRILREAGEEGIIALIHALADASLKADRAAVRDALTLLGRDSIEPLIAALAAPQANVRADAATVLGRLKAREAAMYLVGLAAAPDATPDREAAIQALAQFTDRIPSQQQAAVYLARRMRDYLAGHIAGEIDDEGKITLWRWDDATQTVQRQRLPKSAASLVIADRLAKLLSPLAGNTPSLARLALIVQLEADQTLAGLDQPLPQGPNTGWAIAQALGVNVVEAALADAIAMSRPTAIVALAEVLGASGRPEILSQHLGEESPLALALSYPDRRVQFAALRAILQLDSVEAFPGASRVQETMQYLLTSDGRPRVLVGHPRLVEARRIAALYGELGYEADIATTGNALAVQAARNADYEVILLSDAIDGPNVSETIQVLRKNSRSARIPVGVMEEVPPTAYGTPGGPDEVAIALNIRMPAVRSHVPPETKRRAQLAADVGQPAIVIPPPQSPTSLRFVHDQVVQLMADRIVAPELRLEQASFVLQSLVELLSREQPPGYYDYLRLESFVQYALGNPSLAPQATQVLALLATPRAQLALVEQASLSSIPLEEREAAATALEAAVKRRGLLLTQAEIQRQYDRYNASAQADEATQAVLGRLLDIIEAPTAAQRERKKQTTTAVSEPVVEETPVE
jgi:hypothetical protein